MTITHMISPITLRPSRYGFVLLTSLYLGSLGCLCSTTLPILLKVGIGFLILGQGIVSYWRYDSVSGLAIDHHKRWHIRYIPFGFQGAGKALAGECEGYKRQPVWSGCLMGSSFVSRHLMVLHIQSVDHAHQLRSVVLWSDAMGREEWRRLRVYLRL